MSHLVEVAFKGNRKEFFLWDGEEPPKLHSAVITEADRGEDLGRVHSIGELATVRCTGCAHGCGTSVPTRRILRLATRDDERRAAELRAQDEDARRRARACVQTHGLIMKLTDAEWQWDRKKLTLYFTAEKRVDFRALVRDLASMFRTRIELKQIGVRDEAKRLDGVGRCGRQYCSASWLPELRPVNLQVAKDQRLSLNPSQISGACGRLMCCLRYEHEFYVQSRKRFPKEGRTLRTALGEEKVVSNDIFRDQVTLRNSEGDMRVVPLAELKRELEQRVTSADEREVAERDEEAASSAADAGEDSVLAEEAPTSSRQHSPGGERRERQRRSPAVTGENGEPDGAGENGNGHATTTPHENGDGRSAERAPSGSRGGRRRGRRGGRRNRPAGDAPKDPRSSE